MFKVGDKVKVSFPGRSWCYSGIYKGETNDYWMLLEDNKVSPTNVCKSFDNIKSVIELISKSNNTMGNLKEAFANVFKQEPQKSFNKAGITDSSDVLTPDGQAIFLSWLLTKNGADFKTEVVDPILEAQKEAK